MAGVYDLYGVACEDLEAARALVEAALSVTFEARSSAYHGEYYNLRGEDSSERSILKHNFVPFDGDDWTEPAHQDQPFLLYINDWPNPDDVQRALLAVPGVTFIRRDVVD